MTKDPGLYIIHILESIEEVKEYIPQESTLYENQMAYKAALRVLQTLAESASKLPTVIHKQFPGIPWEQIKAFRNLITHDYLDDYNKELIWQVIAGHLKPLEQAMLTLMPDWKAAKAQKPKRN